MVSIRRCIFRYLFHLNVVSKQKLIFESCLWYCADMLAEVCRREKEENIIPDPDIDIFMKVRESVTQITFMFSIYY